MCVQDKLVLDNYFLWYLEDHGDDDVALLSDDGFKPRPATGFDQSVVLVRCRRLQNLPAYCRGGGFEFMMFWPKTAKFRR